MAKVRVRREATARSLVQVGDVKIPKGFVVSVFDNEDGDPDVDLVFEVRGGAPQCREVHIKATETGHEVQTSWLADLRILDFLELAVRDMALGEVAEVAGGYRIGSRPSQAQRNSAVHEVRAARRALKLTVTDDMLREVAKVYRANVEGHPTKAVADHFDKSHRTAGLYVKRAREAGHLGPALTGKAGER